jgi:hypothetical protein
MGIAVKLPTKGVPTVRVAIVDEAPAGLATVVDAFEVSAPQPEPAAMISEIAEAVASRAKGLGVDRAVVRRADKSQRPSNKEGPRVRLLTEGAITGAVRAVVQDTLLRDGEHCAGLLGMDKAAMQTHAKAVLAAAGTDAKFDEAVAAALAALRT